MTPPNELERYQTPPQVAARYGIKADRVRRWILNGQLRAVNVSDRTRPRWKISPADLEAFEQARSNLPKHLQTPELDALERCRANLPPRPQRRPRRRTAPRGPVHEWY